MGLTVSAAPVATSYRTGTRRLQTAAVELAHRVKMERRAWAPVTASPESALTSQCAAPDPTEPEPEPLPCCSTCKLDAQSTHYLSASSNKQPTRLPQSRLPSQCYLLCAQLTRLSLDAAYERLTPCLRACDAVVGCDQSNEQTVRLPQSRLPSQCFLLCAQLTRLAWCGV